MAEGSVARAHRVPGAGRRRDPGPGEGDEREGDEEGVPAVRQQRQGRDEQGEPAGDHDPHRRQHHRAQRAQVRRHVAHHQPERHRKH